MGLVLPSAEANEAALRAVLESAGQAHLLTFASELTPDALAGLAAQIGQLDLPRVNRIFKTTTASPAAAAKVAKIEPLPADAVFSTIDGDAAEVERCRAAGMAAIAAGEVAVILMAGGQGTRLGSSAPKGCYDIGLPSHKSLFQIQAERIRRLQDLASKPGKPVVIPWYVMCSGPTRAETEKFFREHKFFGLDGANVVFFNQGVLPAFFPDGRIILETPSTIAVAPDGNGGVYAALRYEGILDDLEGRGIKYVHVFGVDNCLVKVADPVFIGYGIVKDADCGVKVVPKSDPTESVGVVCLRDGRYNVVEYSEIDPAVASSADPATGKLRFGAANIANHFFTLGFLKRTEEMEREMLYHIAHKKIRCVDLGTGEIVKPEKNNGIKLELFVFDVFPFAERFVVLESDRKEEFSPLKNAPNTGVDDPQTSRRDILAQMRRFLAAAGAQVAEGAEIEVSPVVTYAGEGLEGVRGKKLAGTHYADSLEALNKIAA
ncbi:UDP-N-acetylglucosamine diphosphorylase [Hyaloraphidium curvatum]|nr:UDP-N-acetylglucosamine diphosphorylase [Hyaloraphidium curvatum]